MKHRWCWLVSSGHTCLWQRVWHGEHAAERTLSGTVTDLWPDVPRWMA